MDLVCASPAEAEHWLDAIRAAIELGGGSVPPPGEGDEDGVQAVGGDSSDDDGAAAPQAGGKGRGRGGPYPPRPLGPGGDSRAGYPGSGNASPVAGAAAAASGAAFAATGAAAALGGAAASRGADSEGAQDDSPGASVAPPKPATTGFLDFGSIEEDVAGEAKAEAGAEPVQEATVVEETSLKAADFGFGADDGSSAASSSAPSSPRGDSGAVEGGGRARSKGSKGSAFVPASSPAAARVSAQVDDLGSDVASPSPSPATKSEGGRGGPAELGASYKDKNEGLTLQQRLANLEFSDDEDDDEDDPLGLKKKG
mmetsp:Transcript_162727/g.517043  ORF Transcript_162727/g.517043 Transcript_162727/m.517043 type:complete len:312 (-) Transcript_162727:123-1058(-)